MRAESFCPFNFGSSRQIGFIVSVRAIHSRQNQSGKLYPWSFIDDSTSASRYQL